MYASEAELNEVSQRLESAGFDTATLEGEINGGWSFETNISVAYAVPLLNRAGFCVFSIAQVGYLNCFRITNYPPIAQPAMPEHIRQVVPPDMPVQYVDGMWVAVPAQPAAPATAQPATGGEGGADNVLGDGRSLRQIHRDLSETAKARGEKMKSYADWIEGQLLLREEHVKSLKNELAVERAAHNVNAERMNEFETALEKGTAELRRYVEGNGFKWCEDEDTVFNVTTALGLMGGTIEALQQQLADAQARAAAAEAVARTWKRAAKLNRTGFRNAANWYSEVCEALRAFGSGDVVAEEVGRIWKQMLAYREMIRQLCKSSDSLLIATAKRIIRDDIRSEIFENAREVGEVVE